MNSKWDSNSTQFARLLSEICAHTDLDGSMDAIAESMDLTKNEINEILERAQMHFHQVTTTPGCVEEISVIQIKLPNGDDAEFALLRETDTNNFFAVEGAYVEQDLLVESPYGNGLLEWVESDATDSHASLNISSKNDSNTDQSVGRANRNVCIECESTEVDYEVKQNGRQFASCASCAAMWYEFSDKDNVVFEVEIDCLGSVEKTSS